MTAIARFDWEEYSHGGAVDAGAQIARRGSFTIYPDQTVKVGRDAANNRLHFESPTVSRFHFEIFSLSFDEIHFVYARDCGSINGTYVNGFCIGNNASPTKSYLLNDGDSIEVKNGIHFQFHQPLQPRKELTALQKTETKQFAGRYQIMDRELGNGHYATVYLAIDLASNEQLACKVQDLDSHRWNPSGIRRLMDEVAILSQLDHPNIVSFRHAFQSPHTIYTLMELGAGGDLFSLTERCQYFSEQDIRRILKQVMNGVHYLHQKGVAHRDLKPENILCADRPSADDRIIISDLGCAGMINRERLMSNVGTPGYQAPECDASSAVGYSTSVDLWGIGMLALQLIRGHRDPEDGHLALRKATQHEVDHKLDNFFQQGLPCGGFVSYEGQEFVRNCLKVDASERWTVRNAKRHSFVQSLEPSNEKLQWKPRKVTANAVEELVDVLKETDGNKRCRFDMPALKPVLRPIAQIPSTTGLTTSQHFSASQKENKRPPPEDELERNGKVAPVRKRQKYVDGAFPYIGLDRHLAQPRNNRRELLDELNAKQVIFMDTK